MNRRKFVKGAVGLFVPATFGILVPRARGQVYLQNRRAAFRPKGGGAAASYLVEEDCEGTGTPSGWSDAASPDWDYTAVPLAGSHSLRMSGTTQRTTSGSFTATGDIWFYFLFRPQVIAGCAICSFVGPAVSGELRSDGTLRIGGSVNSAPTTDAMSVDTTYHVWMHYVKGTGANALFSIAFSTSGTKPTAGNAFTSATTGSETADCTQMRMQCEGVVSATVVFDKLRADDANIGDNPS